VVYGELMATFRVGNEFVALCCDACLSTSALEALTKLREGRRRRTPFLTAAMQQDHTS
jgi:hypothetical protein